MQASADLRWTSKDPQTWNPIQEPRQHKRVPGMAVSPLPRYDSMTGRLKRRLLFQADDMCALLTWRPSGRPRVIGGIDQFQADVSPHSKSAAKISVLSPTTRSTITRESSMAYSTNPTATIYRLFDAHFDEVRGQWEERYERRYGFLESLPMVAPPSLAAQNRCRLSSPLCGEDVVTRFFPGKEQARLRRQVGAAVSRLRPL